MGAALLALLLAPPLWAQDEAETRPGTEEDAATRLDAVIVTVDRREQDLQSYAGTAQVLSQDDLRGLGINNELRNIQAAIPGLSIANQEGNVEIFIRGVGSSNNTELGDPGAAPHLNGNYIPRPRGLGLMFYDLDRVEVNKGPQGTLRGRNALGGTLNIVTKRPELGVTGGYVQGEFGNRDSRGAEAAINLPVGEISALRVSGYHVYKGSSFVNAGIDTNLDPAGIQDEVAGRISFLTEPNEALSIFVMADYGKEGGTGYPGANIFSAAQQGFHPDDLDLRKVVYRGWQGRLENELWGVQANVVYDFGPAALEYNTSHRRMDFAQTNASSDGVLWPGRDVSANGMDYDIYSTVFWEATSRSQTHELRLFSSGDARFRWTIGGFYFNEDQEVGFLSLVDKGYCCYSGTEFTMPDVNGRSWAGFADGVFDVNDAFRLKAGVRYTEERKSRYGIGGNWALVLGGEDGECCFATRLGTPGFLPSLRRRPNFDVSQITTNAQMAEFLLQGVRQFGSRDTLLQQLAGVIDGSAPNGTCVVRPDTDNGFVTCPPDGQHSFLSLTIPSQQFGSSAFDFFDWRAGFEWDLTDRNMLYGTVTTGHKAGGFNDSFDTDLVPETYRPEKLLSVEFGSKNEFEVGGRPAIFNAAVFQYRYTDQVLQDLTTIAVSEDGQATGYSLVSRNVGRSELRGLELESMFRMPYDMMLTAHALFLDAKIKEGVVADVRSQNFGAGGITSLIDLSGNKLPLTSRASVALRLQQTLDLGRGGFDWQVLASYRSAFYLTQFNERDVVFVADTEGTVDRIEDARTAGFPDRQSGYTQVNLGLGYTPWEGSWRLEGWVSNLLNKDVSQKALVGSGVNVRFLNDARSYGVRLRVHF